MTSADDTRVDVQRQPVSIYNHFRGLIVSGRLGSGERLPTVRQTAVDLGVSPGTAARAYKQLEQDGLVSTRVGSGTRVAVDASPLPVSVASVVRRLVRAARENEVDPADVAAAVRAEFAATDI